jgi:hypothetical protein
LIKIFIMILMKFCRSFCNNFFIWNLPNENVCLIEKDAWNGTDRVSLEIISRISLECIFDTVGAGNLGHFDQFFNFSLILVFLNKLCDFFGILSSGNFFFFTEFFYEIKGNVHVIRNTIFWIFRPPLPLCNKKPYKSLYF